VLNPVYHTRAARVPALAGNFGAAFRSLAVCAAVLAALSRRATAEQVFAFLFLGIAHEFLLQDFKQLRF
jgi:hypothetical protein